MDAATPEAQVEALRADRLAGKVGDVEFFSKMDMLGPKLGQSTPTAPATAHQAQQQLAQLLERRQSGKVGDVEFHAEMERLGEKAHPAADPFEAMRDEIMAPAAPHEYQFAHEPGADLTGERLEWDTALRAAFSDAGLPKHLGGAINAAANVVLRKLMDAAPEIQAAHVATFHTQMRQIWGDAYEARREAVASYVDEWKKGDKVLGAFVDEMPWILADVTIANALWSMVEHRQRRPRR